MAEQFSGQPLLRHDGSTVDGGDALKGKKVVGLLFSAMWCPSCKQFLPKIKKFYNEMQEAGKSFEIVLVSRDKEEDHMLEYLKEHNGNWLAIPFGDERIQ
ncbi:hypothetical protein WR25_02979 [Diploscapter pachys]|uniref:Thioredoxin domain-containing protein n=1 Tax=Diploscapter pachys TaxID=2018661 RepID=A0A2A2K3M3_9BILA|nr:hypothetical protein WR25_02979 [Diploscapter pachys]